MNNCMKKMAFFYIVFASVLWGTSGIFFNLLAPFGFSSLQMTAMRGVVAAIAFTIYILFTDRKLFKVGFKNFCMFALNGITMYGSAVLYYEAIKQSSVSAAVILMYTAPIFVMAYSVAFLGEKLTLQKLISVALVTVGCALVSGIAGGIKISLLGLVFGLGSGVVYSAYNIVARIEMMKNMNALSASLYGFIVMGILSFIFCNPTQLVQITMQNPAGIIPLIIGIGVCTSVLPYFLYTLALRDIPAGTASALGIIEPMSATLFSVILFGEKLSIFSVLGIILILTAVFVLSKAKE